MNWYKEIKVANALAKSLGIPGGSDLFGKVQKFEKQLKNDGKWQKIMQTKKNVGKEKATQLLIDTIESYIISVENMPPEIDTSNSSELVFVERTSTGGDWYNFGEEHGLYHELVDDSDYDRDEAFAYNSYFKERLKDGILKKLELKIEPKISRFKNTLKRIDNILDNKEDNNTQQYFEFYDPLEKYEYAKERIEQRINNVKQSLEEVVKILDDDDDDDWNELKDYLVKNNLIDENDFDNFIDDIKTSIWDSHIDSLRGELEENIQEYYKVTCGGQWCISPPGNALIDFLANGDEFTILRRDGKPRIAIRSNYGMISEIQGPANSFDRMNGLDFIDLLDCPDFDEEDILSSLSDGIHDLHGEFIENLSRLNDEEVTGPIKEFLREHDDLVLRYLEGNEDGVDRFMNEFNAIVSQGPSEIMMVLIEIIRNNLNDISLTGELDSPEEGKQYTWVHSALKNIKEDYGKIIFYKEIFVGKEKELLSQFFDSVLGSEHLSVAKQWLSSNLDVLTALFGDLPKAMLSEEDIDTKENRINPFKYFGERLYLQDDLSDLQQNPQIYFGMTRKALTSLNYERGQITEMHARVINGAYETGLMILGESNKNEILYNIGSLIFEGINNMFYKYNHYDYGNKAMMLLHIILDRLPKEGVHSDIINLLKQDSDVQEAWSWYQENMVGSNQLDTYREKLESYPENNSSVPVNEKQSSVITSSWYN